MRLVSPCRASYPEGGATCQARSVSQPAPTRPRSAGVRGRIDVEGLRVCVGPAVQAARPRQRARRLVARDLDAHPAAEQREDDGGRVVALARVRPPDLRGRGGTGAQGVIGGRSLGPPRGGRHTRGYAVARDDSAIVLPSATGLSTGGGRATSAPPTPARRSGDNPWTQPAVGEERGVNREVFITCAVTGAGDTTRASDRVPVTPEEIADSALDAARAGAAVVHIHVRDPATGRGARDVDALPPGGGAHPRLRRRRGAQPHRRDGRRPRPRRRRRAAAARRRRAPTWPARPSASPTWRRCARRSARSTAAA